MINQWTELIWKVASTKTLVISGVRKIVSDIQFQLTWDQLNSCELKYSDICYTPSKEKQLLRNYWNEDEVEAAVEKLLSRKGKVHSSVSIQLRGREKDSRSQGYCMQNMVITITPEKSYVDIYYRSTEVIQKFLADLIFFSRMLPKIFDKIGVSPDLVRFKFANVYLSSVFIPIFIRYEENPDGFFLWLKRHDLRFYRTCGLSTRKFFNEDHNYSYRTRVKMFEYWKEHVDHKKVRSLQNRLSTLTGNIKEDGEDDEV